MNKPSAVERDSLRAGLHHATQYFFSVTKRQFYNQRVAGRMDDTQSTHVLNAVREIRSVCDAIEKAYK